MRRYLTLSAAILIVAGAGIFRATTSTSHERAVSGTKHLELAQVQASGTSGHGADVGSKHHDQKQSGESQNVKFPPEAVEKLKKGDLPLDLTVTPQCAGKADTMTATLKAVPGAHVSLGVAYSNGHNYGAWYAGPTDPSGSLVFSWIIPPAAPEGQGLVLAAGSDPNTDRSGTTGATFQVTGGGSC